ncbi:TAXI family TRAP transporter solute-binding subunit [Candidatus Venteria ishoeyi]|uniref:NMT1/THI5 like protein n=1 Tax=Candidatus Venteria ishoeyi TaxID=1899563 RepID=A0A1H6F594_9GAMM|nr:TAXI family TRAP transporter solute-binding subunit [Candidatus Venteria ishoeyi]SEH04449.1 Uncharacterised protein [Candidatus Venteria ishoeyi]
MPVTNFLSMSMPIKYLPLLFLCFFLTACNETKEEAQAKPVEKTAPAVIEKETEPEKTVIPAILGLVTGSSSGTYIKFGDDIARVATQADIKILVKESGGSLDNVRRINSSENAALGIVQSDVLGYLSRHPQHALRKFVAPLRLILPLYNEEVHLFARKNIRDMTDLQGKQVITGGKGSGTFLTAHNLLALLDITPAETLDLPPTKALMAVLRNEADAMFYVAGKPVDLFKRLNKLQQDPELAPLLKETHFVALDNPVFFKEYSKAKLTPKDYPWLQKTINTIAVKALLVGYNFSSRKDAYYAARCDQLAQLTQVLHGKLTELRRKGHPKWREVKNTARYGKWRRNQCTDKAVK